MFEFAFFFSFKVIKGRYEAEGDKRETDEFLKPIIVDPEGRIRGLFMAASQSLWLVVMA